ncbi:MULTISPECIES: flagellar hook-basal body complex protein FliE [Pseudovibrio]|uniref:flagellar hook-basal body complex protein FliE n=1 Tax=Stappiaceae TaxID=2821832 RepID=UPI002365BFB5|nr:MULTISPECIES: flagellar hook-basal body complex protein FliE [Pseudovibrio]MDD7909018.1 flagellar hook-basal body complex protein FliE [Pseudovibrio exalbescens]MDX5593661.1 flagellar hook-basal body complex protein FliE [Pseudovibrio sp. SPO723]
MVGFIEGLGAIGSLSSSSRLAGTGSIGGVAESRQYAPVSDTTATQEASFTDVMADAMKETANTLKTAEVTSVAGIKGEVSAQAVVEAVMNAEVQLQSAIAIRDKVVSAYQEFSRMTI